MDFAAILKITSAVSSP